MVKLNAVGGNVKRIPVMKPLLPSAHEVLPYLQRIDASRLYSNFGPLSSELISRLADYFRVDDDNVLLVSNGTLAIQAAVATSSSPNSNWEIPSWTFIATAQAVVSAGSIVQFRDVERDTWALSPDSGRLVSGVIPVVPFGGKVQLEPWALESMHHPVIIDAASCFDSSRDLSLVNKYNISVMVSLHATKLVTTGEGGVIIGPKAWIAEMKRWINFGFYGDRIARRTGSNAKLSEYQAAVGLASLDQWELTRESWFVTLKKLSDGLLESSITVQPAISEGYVSSTLVAMLENSAAKISLERRLSAAEIDSRDWWGAGVHNMPAFKSALREDQPLLPVTEELASRTIGLPMFVDLGDDEIERIIEAVAN
jgi:dTDP-4-amino-4,6-dideoxygalactose transaminase